MRYSLGFSTLEVLVWLSVFTFTVGAVVSSILYFYRVNAVTLDQASSVASAQRGIDAMVRAIREAAYASDGAYPIVSLADDQFAFYADVDADPLIEKVRYYLNGSAVMEGVGDPSGDPPAYTGAETTSVVSQYVRNADESLVMFTYYDEEGAQVTDYADIAAVRFVTVNIVVDVDTGKLPDPFYIRSSAALRNLSGQ
ncbi:hypothetical protein A3C21_02555 [Candidatus Kaiserbacteria bacterium RIFCSPHIGHO2_02_FULL_59_21]|uniref:Type II secretion system protein J n=1 Tax=Candidatus Kaiserbacteria bacterium RIFCSPHIGHO2_02_FULL_59_21 TaxID=1798500 RepID=A0A1F6E0Y9_9BACT|nr:MAG: hypothetical protein A2766_03090 [Candidatus Kaiserbacteria bacterium RIFCSPHIGHO2_01_FULL_58_22]OGG67210.1 MAG: hypothetical protein A3C21_02555 [Candidatus Kaiserbacteria bacterium RIFCSPHIGHO2_02_FULL_59_21]OGG79721.1 MAG: hypothetical protein A2952_03115 [Candidatus Kaiserbacteria bacterium RIFCSPLOWO2_01_FULL_59_34]OGG86374.1 MAG: hypothetical protein A3I47_00715 [Candidatus Kaiserbacteria bacterium RIFCSPLOWO2_02_FULL_59_19]